MNESNTLRTVFYRWVRALRCDLWGVVLATALVTALTSCASAPRTIAGERNTNALRSEAPGKRDLITINSLRLAPLTSSAGLQIEAADLRRFYQTLNDAFSVESGIDIHSEKSEKGSADATLQAEITRYAKDSSSALGASKAALFAVNYSIVRQSDQKEIWASSYFSTEHPDSTNLIEVTRRIARDKGTRLPTIQELEVEAAHSAAVDFASRREQQYVVR